MEKDHEPLPVIGHVLAPISPRPLSFAACGPELCGQLPHTNPKRKRGRGVTRSLACASGWCACAGSGVLLASPWQTVLRSWRRPIHPPLLYHAAANSPTGTSAESSPNLLAKRPAFVYSWSCAQRPAAPETSPPAEP